MPQHEDVGIEAERRAVASFVEREIIPLEADPASYDPHQNIRLDLLEALRGKVKAAGLWAPQMPGELGGMGLSCSHMAVLYEEMGRSIFGPVCFNAAAPDDGNMILLNKVLGAAEKREWLVPLVEGRMRSAFAMTEPAPGSGWCPWSRGACARPSP
jgi:acyl-CoA dehydrogenase